MSISNEFLAQIAEAFETLGQITCKKMFGGAGIYCDGVLFAIADDEVMFIKVDSESAQEFEGQTQASYATKDGEVMKMNYFSVPDSVWDSAEEARMWGQKGILAAERAAQKKSRRKG